MRKKINKEMSDADYWKQYEETGEEGEESLLTHPVSLDVVIKFKENSDEEIYEIKQKDIGCNPEDLQTFFDNLKKTIRMLDESIVADEDEGL